MDKITGIGLMSGTSLDGLDIAVVSFFKQGNEYRFEWHFTDTIPFENELKTQLSDPFNLSALELVKLENQYSLFVSNVVNDSIKRLPKGISPKFVSSHGQTLYHNPREGYTLQIGNGPLIASLTQLKCIYDFRRADVALGGQGAPLVPVGDQFLFKNYDSCLNIGGFANVYLADKNLSFDICPANVVLNRIAEKENLNFDEDGKMAASGIVNSALLEELNQLDYYKIEGQKSLGVEFVLDRVLPLINLYNLSNQDLSATYTEHMAIQISRCLKSSQKILITGGGAFNKHLIKRIEFHINRKIELPSNQLINYKEALIFAFLGYLRILGENNVYKMATGASKNHIAGSIHLP